MLCCVVLCLCGHVTAKRNISTSNGTVSNNTIFDVIYIQYTDICSQTAKLELLREERRSLWEAWSDVALIRNWASEEIFVSFRHELR